MSTLETYDVYEFGGFRLDPLRRVLTRGDGEPIALKPKVFDTLLYLVEHPGELVDKQALLDGGVAARRRRGEQPQQGDLDAAPSARRDARRASLHRDGARPRLPVRRAS